MGRLTELQTLVAIADEGSLAGAARRLRRSPPSITRDLATLERRVGVMLVERSTRRCRPTPAGHQLVRHARQLMIDYEALVSQAVGQAVTLRGLIRITAPITLGRDHVAPLVTRFLDEFPEISIELQLTDRLVDLVGEEFDLAVRIGRLGDAGLIARRVGGLSRLVVASPAYLQAHGTPDRPADLANHQVVTHGEGASAGTWMFARDGGGETAWMFAGRYQVNQPEAAVAAARESRGVVRALSHQVHDDIEAGRLVRLLRDYETAPLAVSLVWPRSRHSWRRVRLMAEHLATGLKALPALRGEG